MMADILLVTFQLSRRVVVWRQLYDLNYGFSYSHDIMRNIERYYIRYIYIDLMFLIFSSTAKKYE